MREMRTTITTGTSLTAIINGSSSALVRLTILGTRVGYEGRTPAQPGGVMASVLERAPVSVVLRVVIPHFESLGPNGSARRWFHPRCAVVPDPDRVSWR